MENFEEIKAKARQKIEGEITNTDDYMGQIGMFLLSWIEYADNAAELIMTEGKDMKGAFRAIRDYASKNREKKGNYACVAPTKAMELVLEYFGQADPQGVIEGGLMYKAMMDAANKSKPYGTEAAKTETVPQESGTSTQESGTDTPESGTEPKAQPVAEPPKKSLSALESLSLEDLGL